ncbi:hypothetical protein GCM10010497_56650 [Streptomyces cinereoruber]|nr:hypothetical protein [Streptomyces cinereoruber]MBB4158280.1 hypothetical protein [Streptomyces cinereoruber]MBY8814236.1 hypothetical protein [Streptomyces cinereoruber]NIH58941.1 hypothetical protein [Streptomyces cinereoruber]GGR45926.1 hypothetical protein GCM10010497_56650 [Streptomyces cinereoruber]
MVLAAPSKEWVTEALGEERTERSEEFEAGALGVVDLPGLKAAVLTPCSAPGTVVGGSYSISIVVHLRSHDGANDAKVKQRLVDLVVEAARFAHRNAKCDLPSGFPSKAPGSVRIRADRQVTTERPPLDPPLVPPTSGRPDDRPDQEEPMKSMRTVPRHPARLWGAAAGAVLALTVSCSSPAREYAVPTDLCGIEVPASALEPVLPPGKEISAHPTDPKGTGIARCRLHVDGESVFSASIERWEEGASARDVAGPAQSVGPGDAQSEDARFVYSATGAVGRVDCRAADDAGGSVWATVRTTRDGTTAEQMKDLITAYADSAATSGECSKVLT